MIQPKDDYRNKMSDPAPLSCFAEIIPFKLLGSKQLFYVLISGLGIISEWVNNCDNLRSYRDISFQGLKK